jgi:hypothetical protein
MIDDDPLKPTNIRKAFGENGLDPEIKFFIHESPTPELDAAPQTAFGRGRLKLIGEDGLHLHAIEIRLAMRNPETRGLAKACVEDAMEKFIESFPIRRRRVARLFAAIGGPFIRGVFDASELVQPLLREKEDETPFRHKSKNVIAVILTAIAAMAMLPAFPLFLLGRFGQDKNLGLEIELPSLSAHERIALRDEMNETSEEA